MQPAAVAVPLQVSLSVALPAVVALHELSQVMLQVPPEQVTFEPAPTVWVQLVPAQSTLQLAPQLPVQLDPAAQAKLQLAVELLQASKAHC